MLSFRCLNFTRRGGLAQSRFGDPLFLSHLACPSQVTSNDQGHDENSGTACEVQLTMRFYLGSPVSSMNYSIHGNLPTLGETEASPPYGQATETIGVRDWLPGL